MKSSKFSLRGIIILSMLGMILITTALMIYMFFNFDIKVSNQATIITNPYLWFALIIVTMVVFLDRKSVV